MQSTSSAPSTDTTIIRTGSDGRLRYTPAQRGELLEAFDRSGLSAMAFSRQHGICYQTTVDGRLIIRQSGKIQKRIQSRRSGKLVSTNHENRRSLTQN